MAIGIHQSLGVIVQKKIKVKIMINTLSLTLNQKIFKVNYKIKKKSKLKFNTILKKIVI